MTCGEDATKCAGHYGYIKLHLPIFHIGYFRPTINMLSSICKVSRPHATSIIEADHQTCSRILLTPAERAYYLTKFRRANLEALQRQAAQKAVLTLCKKQPICPHCGSANGVVKKSGPLKISHEPYRSTKVKDLKEEEKSKMATVVGENRGLAAALEKKQDDMNALKVYELFRKVSPEVSRGLCI